MGCGDVWMLADAALERIGEARERPTLARAEAILRAACGDRVRTAFPLAPLTTFRIGGPAALYLEPESEADLAAAARGASRAGVPFVVIGKGSNVLVVRRGFPGLVLRLGRGYRWAARDGDRLTAGGAMPLPALAGVALRHGLAGLEFGVAIPATLGGAVRMNAGAHGDEMADVVERIRCVRSARRARRAGRRRRRPDSPTGDRARRTMPSWWAPRRSCARRSGPDPAAMDEAREWRRRDPAARRAELRKRLQEPARRTRGAPDRGGRAARARGSAAPRSRQSTRTSSSPSRARGGRRPGADPGSRRSWRPTAGVVLEPEVQLIGGFDDARR